MTNTTDLPCRLDRSVGRWTDERTGVDSVTRIRITRSGLFDCSRADIKFGIGCRSARPGARAQERDREREKERRDGNPWKFRRAVLSRRSILPAIHPSTHPSTAPLFHVGTIGRALLPLSLLGPLGIDSIEGSVKAIRPSSRAVSLSPRRQ